MKISVIIPAYNIAKYLPATLAAVKNQTFDDFEIIAVDDGSTDETYDVLQSFSKENPGRMIVIHQENRGVSAARNAALREASGEYIAFVDSDDLLEKDYLRSLLEAAEAVQADMVKCSYEWFDDADGRVLGSVSAAERNVEYAAGKKYVFHYCIWASLYRADFLKNYNILFSVGEQMEDSPFSLLTNQLAGHVAIVDRVLYHHRVHASSIMDNVAKAVKNPLIPYRGLEEAITSVRTYLPAEERDFSDYLFVRVLADFLTVRYKTQGKSVRHTLCTYARRIMDTYFPAFPSNPYLQSGMLKELPLFEREAVRLFSRSYEHGTLFAFSAMVSFVLRFIK